MEVEEITKDWLRRRLGWRVLQSDTVFIRTITPPNALMGRIYRVECAGRAFILKCPPAYDSVWRQLFEETGLHDREVQAYRFLGTSFRGSHKVAPECYWSVSNHDGSGALALEDITQRQSPMARFTSGLNYEQATATVRTLATLHSLLATTDADALSPPYPWMFSALSEGLIAAIEVGLRVLPGIAEQRLPRSFPHEVLMRIVEVDIKRVVSESHVGSKFLSFCHGDAWSKNILFKEGKLPREAPAAIMIDWQFAMWGNPLSDIALLILSSIAPDSRRHWTGDLLRQYHSTLIQRCEISYSFEECLADFARASSYGGLVAVATLDAYTSGMTASQLELFASRLEGILQDFPELFNKRCSY